MQQDQNIFYITKPSQCIRIDKLLSDYFKCNSRTYFQNLLEKGLVLVNQNIVKKRFTPKIGDEIEVFFQATQTSDLIAENIALDILYEDEDIVAINKQANMVVHPALGNWQGTLVNALLHRYKDLISSENDLRPGIVHRLDKDTTGVLIAAKNQKTQNKLIELFKNKKIKKTYIAITLNKALDQIIDAPISRHPIKRKLMSVQQNGKEAKTQIKTIDFKNNLSLIKAFPITGRTHQIRVHLKHINCPIIGDPVYGIKAINEKFKISSQLLHALSIEFIHPISSKKLFIEAPLPKTFQEFTKNFY